MTAQMPDQFTYEDEEYSIIGVKGNNLFNPSDFNLEPITVSTACYRGYVVAFN